MHLQGPVNDEGSFVIGSVDSILCPAVTSDDNSMYAALVRCDGETLLQLLEAALAQAFPQDDYTDENNG